MSDSDIRRCEECGGELPPGIPAGLCPRCVLAEAEDGTPVITRPLFDQDVPPEAPRAFGDYELLEEIARGGMGIVYKAWQKSLERFVVIKMLLFGSHSTAELIRRFRGEAVLAGGLHHPNIVPIYEIGIHEGQHFIVMDYVDGPNLSAFLRAEPLSIRAVVLCLGKIAGAIHYAHEQNVLHRDLKPSNVLLDSEGEPHVTDFGLARKIDGESTITISGQVLGSPNYMPPEQAAPKQGKVSRRSDVYGLGAILYHCLTGRPPFQAETLEATLRLVLTADPVSPRLLNPSVGRDLETICLKCLEKEPARRYENAHEVAEELGRFLNHRPIQARPITRVERLTRWCRRNPHLTIALGAATIFFVSGVILLVWQVGRAKREAELAQFNQLWRYVADMNLAKQALQRNNYAYAREKLLAHLPKKGLPDLRGWEWRHLWRRCEADYLASFDVGEAAPALALSPDGTIAAAVRRDGQVQVLDFRYQGFTTNLSAGPSQASRRSIAFSPDGAWLAMADRDRVRLARPGLWNTRELTAHKTGTVFSVLFSTRGDRLFATSSAGLKMWEMPSGNEVPPPVIFTNNCRLLDISADGQWLALSTDAALMAWNLSSGTQVLARVMGGQQIPALALSRNGLLAACDREGFARVWDLPTMERTGATNPMVEWDTRVDGPNYAAAFSPDGALLALAGSDQAIHIYSTTNWQECASLKGHQDEVWALAFTVDSARLISTGKDGLVNVWDPGRRPLNNTLPGSWFPLGFTPDSQFAVTLNNPQQRLMQFWNATNHSLDHTLKLLTNITPQFQEITPDGSTAVVKTSRNVLCLINLGTGMSRGVLNLDTNRLESATFSQCSPDSQFVAAATTRKWDGQSILASEVFSLKTRERLAIQENFRALVFSQNGRFVGGRDAAKKPAVWDLRRRQVKVFDDLRGETIFVAFSHDNRLFAAGSGDGPIGLWDLASGRRVNTFKGHRAGVGKIQFSHDDRTLFSTSTDRSLRLFNVATGQEMLSLNERDEPFELTLSSDDTTLAVGGVLLPNEPRISPVKLWHAPPLSEIDAALHATGQR